MADELAAWLLEQVEADERDAHRLAKLIADGYFDEREDEFRRNPVRELAECDAKRQTVEAVQRRERGHPGPHANYIGQPPDAYDEYDSCAHCIRWNETTLGPYALRLLALPLADRPGYQESWRP